MAQTTMTMAEFLALSAGTKKGKKPTKPKKQKKADEPKRADMFRPVTEPIRVRLPWPVSINDYYIRTRFGGVAIGKRGKAYRATVIDEWQRQAGSVTFTGRIAVRLTCVFPNAIERDLDNIEKCLFDALQHAGAFRTDSQIKLKVSEQNMIEKPGWVDVLIGPKPGVPKQSTLFATDF